MSIYQYLNGPKDLVIITKGLAIYSISNPKTHTNINTRKRNSHRAMKASSIKSSGCRCLFHRVPSSRVP